MNNKKRVIRKGDRTMTNSKTSGHAAAVLVIGLLALAGGIAQAAPAGFAYTFDSNWIPGPQRTGGLVLADFNGDGQMDAAVPGVYMAGVAVLLNNASGGAVRTWVDAGAWPMAVAAGDLDGDGDADLAVVERDGSGVAVYTNNGSGVFARTGFYSTGAGSCPTGVAIADIDKDGKNDLVVTNRAAETVVVLRNTGSGFAVQQTIPVSWEPNALVAVDVDKDGWMDIAVACASDDTVKVLKNTAGVLGLAGAFDAGEYPVAVTAGDINGDGYMDLVVADREADKPTVLINNTTGGFSVLPNVPPSAAVDVLAIDTNFDNKVDIVTGSGVLIGNGLGGFTAQAGTGYSYALAQGALTGDTGLFIGYNKGQTVTVAYQAAPVSAVAGDATGDGHVDVVDLLCLVGSFGKAAGEAGFDGRCDFNGDGAVDVVDLLVLVGSFGQ
jgi:hypothetical protein